MDQIHHNTVTGTDHLGNGANIIGDQILGIAKPNVGTVYNYTETVKIEVPADAQ